MLKLMLIGNLTRDPELRTVDTANGKRSVTNFTVAVNGRRDGEATYVRISVWDTLAENCARYLAKGRKVYCECNQLSARTYQAQDGTSRMSIEATANSVEFLSSNQQSGEAPAAAPAPAQAPQAPMQQRMTAVNMDEDELPF